MKYLTIIFSIIISLASTFVAKCQNYPTVQKYGNKYRFEKNGRAVSKDYDIAYDFYNNNLAIVGNKNLIGKYKYGYINANGTEVIPLEYDDAKQFSEGLAAVKKNDKFGFINESGRLVIPFQYGDVEWGFIAGKAWVHPNKRHWCLIDKSQSIVKETDCFSAKKFDYQTGAIELEYYPPNSYTSESKYYDKDGDEYVSLGYAQIGAIIKRPISEIKVYEATTNKQEYKVETQIKTTTPINKIEIEIVDNSKYKYKPNSDYWTNWHIAQEVRLAGFTNSVTTIDVTNNISINSNFVVIKRNLPFKEGYNFFFIKVTNSRGSSRELVGVMNCTRGPVDDKPILNLLSATSTSSPNYHFKVGVKSAVKIKSVRFSVNGVFTRGIEVVPDNTYDLNFERDVVLQNGDNTLSLSVTNANGNTTTQNWVIRYTPVPSPAPILNLLSVTSTTSPNYHFKVGVKSAVKVKSVSFSVNGTSTRGIEVVPDNTYDFDFERDVILQNENNTLTLSVTNVNGGTTTKSWNIVYQQTPPPTPSKRIALVIGNSEYKSPMWGSLPNPKNDANAIASALRKYGFTVILKNDLSTKSSMMDAVRSFGQTATTYDVAMVYYAGHGCMAKGENYLIPTTASTTTEADIMEMCMSANYIQNTLEANNNRLNIIVVDACRSTIGRGSRGPSLMTPAVGTVVFYSVSPNQRAGDGVPGGYSPFAKSFLKWIDQPNTLFEMFCKKVTDDVYMETVQTQRPWLMGSVVGEFMFNQQ